MCPHFCAIDDTPNTSLFCIMTYISSNLTFFHWFCWRIVAKCALHERLAVNKLVWICSNLSGLMFIALKVYTLVLYLNFNFLSRISCDNIREWSRTAFFTIQDICSVKNSENKRLNYLLPAYFRRDVCR